MRDFLCIRVVERPEERGVEGGVDEEVSFVCGYGLGGESEGEVLCEGELREEDKEER